MVYIILMLFICQLGNAQNVDWPNYALDKGGQRYAQLDQINSDNIDQLTEAWTFHTGEYDRYKDDGYLVDRAAFEATPIVVNGTMYFPSPSNQLFALDAKTGAQIWHFDPKVDLFHTEFSELTSRGVSYWTNGTDKRIIMGTVDGRLMSIDANNGALDKNFGTDGIIDLKLSVGLVQVTSAPAIINDIVIVGTSIGDNNRTHDSRGVVRAYNVLNGTLLWDFDPIPTSPDDPAYKEWKNGSAHVTGAANVWSTISVDEENNLVFLPTSCPSPDFYGGQRLGNNDYANSVVALDASTGDYKWHFQVVHHDIWDYDVAAQPVLFDFPVDENNSVPAVAIGTKMGHIFVLNRLTGEALLPYEERKVPQSDIPGEVTSPTQPFPIAPSPLGMHNFTEADIFAISAEEHKLAVADFKSRRYEGTFTPPSLQGTIVTPGNTGGIHWGGMSYDSDRNILVTNINRFAHLIQLIERHNPEQRANYLASIENDGNDLHPEQNRMFGTPFRMSRMPYVKVSEQGAFFYNKPPYGTIVGIQMPSGTLIWEKPLGYLGEGDQRLEGSLNLGGTCLTKSGLIFVAATVDNHLRAFHTQTGDEIWKHQLPASGIATPMTYSIDGKQYIAIAAGGHGKNPLSKKGDSLVVFSLRGK